MWNSSLFNTGIIASISCIGLTLLIFVLLNDFLFSKKYNYIFLSFSSILLILITICQCSYFNFYTPELPINQFTLWKTIFYNYIVILIICLYSCGIKNTIINLSINIVCILFCVNKLNIIAALILCIQLISIIGYFFVKKYLKRANKNYIKHLSMTSLSTCITFIITYFFLSMIIQKSCHINTYVEVSLLFTFVVIFGLIFTSFIIGRTNAFEDNNKSTLLFYSLVILIGSKISLYLINLNFLIYLPFNFSYVIDILLNYPVIYFIFELAIIMLISLCYFWFYRSWCRLIKAIDSNEIILHKSAILTFLRINKKSNQEDKNSIKNKNR